MSSIIPLPLDRHITFSNGQKMPIVGLGTSKAKPEEMAKSVCDAIDAGYRHIDTAQVYVNEKHIGKAIKSKISEGVITREDLFITSKLWATDHRLERVRPALENTLKNLGTAYLDLYLIHTPFSFMPISPEDYSIDGYDGSITFDTVADFVTAWHELERAVDDGLVRSIGVSNFNRAQCERLLAVCRIRPVVNQVECHPYLPQHKMLAYLQSEGIHLTAHCPLGSPARLTATADDPVLMDEPIVRSLAEKYGKTSAQILIRYQMERGNSAIPKSVSRSRVQSNFEVFDFCLDAADMRMIDSLERKNGRLMMVLECKQDRNYPFNDEY